MIIAFRFLKSINLQGSGIAITWLHLLSAMQPIQSLFGDPSLTVIYTHNTLKIQPFPMVQN